MLSHQCRSSMITAMGLIQRQQQGQQRLLCTQSVVSSIRGRCCPNGTWLIANIQQQQRQRAKTLLPMKPSFRWTATTTTTSTTTRIVPPLSNALLFRYLNLQNFSATELETVFDQIVANNDHDKTKKDMNCDMLKEFLMHRISQLEQEEEGGDHKENNDVDDHQIQQLKYEFCQRESTRIWNSLMMTTSSAPKTTTTTLTKSEFVSRIQSKASQVDRRLWPITASMILVGASVGVITPAMPFIVEQLALSTSEYGMVVSAFALAKMAFNIPSAILVERHGRKPFMVHSMGIIALGVGGIGYATSFEQLYVCRLFTGAGVSLLSGAATLMVTDLSTPLNRASTLAPIMSGFAAGSTLGPALGGVLVDTIGLDPTFYAVGLSYLGVAAFNQTVLTETQKQRNIMTFHWQQQQEQQQQSSTQSTHKPQEPSPTILTSIKQAMGQWIPLLKRPQVQSILAMNAFYWFALAGAQMTILPLLLTDPTGSFAMTATQVGRVYMGMSLIQIIGNPIFARWMDWTGKAPAIVGGCTLIGIPMATLPMCTNVTQLTAVLACWAVGSSMLSTAPLAYVSDSTNEVERAQAIALLRTCGDVGFLVGASAIGALGDWTGSFEQAMQASSALLFVSTAWFATRQLLLHRQTQALFVSSLSSTAEHNRDEMQEPQTISGGGGGGDKESTTIHNNSIKAQTHMNKIT